MWGGKKRGWALVGGQKERFSSDRAKLARAVLRLKQVVSNKEFYVDVFYKLWTGGIVKNTEHELFRIQIHKMKNRIRIHI